MKNDANEGQKQQRRNMTQERGFESCLNDLIILHQAMTINTCYNIGAHKQHETCRHGFIQIKFCVWSIIPQLCTNEQQDVKKSISKTNQFESFSHKTIKRRSDFSPT